MSDAIAFDTHKFVKRLTATGFTEEQAEALANEQVNLLNSNLTTKVDIAIVQRDIETLRQETKADIAVLQRDIEALRQETKADMAVLQRDIEALRQETRANMEALKVDLLKWIFGALIAQGGLIVALVKLL